MAEPSRFTMCIKWGVVNNWGHSCKIFARASHACLLLQIPFKAEENISSGIAKPLITSKTSTTALEKVVLVIRAKPTEEPGYKARLNQERLKVAVKIQ